jgi:hypothetical protein
MKPRDDCASTNCVDPARIDHARRAESLPGWSGVLLRRLAQSLSPQLLSRNFNLIYLVALNLHRGRPSVRYRSLQFVM